MNANTNNIAIFLSNSDSICFHVRTELFWSVCITWLCWPCSSPQGPCLSSSCSPSPCSAWLPAPGARTPGVAGSSPSNICTNQNHAAFVKTFFALVICVPPLQHHQHRYMSTKLLGVGWVDLLLEGSQVWPGSQSSSPLFTWPTR